MSFGIEVRGLDEFRKNLRRIDDQLGKELGKENKAVGELVVVLAEKRRFKMAGKFPSYRARVVKIKPSANQRRVIVTIRPGAAEQGARRHPVFGRWMDQAGFSRRVWPPEKQEGYMVRPAVEDDTAAIGELYATRISRFARSVIE